jgi:transposase InsO family protein
MFEYHNNNMFSKLKQEVQQSMSRKGNCWDNSVAESFFKSIKVELIYRTLYERKEQAALAVFEWIETWYNRNRRHSALGKM